MVGSPSEANTRDVLKDGITKITSGRTGKVTYEANWSFEDASGKRRWGRKRCPTLKAAKLHRAQMMTSIATGGHTAPAKRTVGDYVEGIRDEDGRLIEPGWFDARSLVWETSTGYIRRRQWDLHIKPYLKDVKLTTVSRAQCQAIVKRMDDAGKKPQTIRNVWALLAAIFRQAVDDGLILRSPATRLTLPPIHHEAQQTWSEAEVQAFLTATQDSPDFPMYYLMLTTGIRIGEAIALRWEHVDLERKSLTIADTIRRTATGSYRPASRTKTDRIRTIGLTAGCIAVLTRHKHAQDAQKAVATRWDPRDYVFAQSNGKYLEQLTFRAHLEADIAKAGLPRLTPHGFRHTLATIMMVNGVQDRAIQDTLGHATISTTMGMYAHVKDELRRATSDRIAALLDVDIPDDSAES